MLTGITFRVEILSMQLELKTSLSVAMKFQVAYGFVSGVSAGLGEQWQQVNIEVREITGYAAGETDLLAPSASVDANGALFFQLMPNRY